MRRVALGTTGESLPAIGQGTWGMGVARERRAAEIEALRLGIASGMTLIDTAEYYAAGGAEDVVGEAVRDCRDQVFLLTKVWPAHATYAEATAAVRRCLRRLRTDRLDAVLVHWPPRPGLLPEMLRALADLQDAGAVRHVGLSNFDLRWLRRAERVAPARLRLPLDEVPYSLPRRGVEEAVLPRLQSAGRVLLAYSPLGHGRLAGWRGHADLAAVAAARGATPAQVALAFLVAHAGVVAIPKAVTPAHVRANAAAGDLRLTDLEMARLQAAFPRRGGPHLPILPPSTAFFRLVLAAERLLHGGAAP